MRRPIALVAIVAALLLAFPSAALAYTFTRNLQEGDTGPDVKALEVRVAGWYPEGDQSHLSVDRRFGPETTAAIKAFQEFYGLEPDGIAGPSTYAVIDGLEDDNGSTLHFDWREFKQNRNTRCSAKANAYAGTFGGGMVAPLRVRKNVKRVMWRLEALRAKAGDRSVGINSGYRSVPYNDCIGGARLSQHMYGTAADNRMADTDNHTERELARLTQFHGIGCYSSLSHNHFDIRLDNRDLDGGRYWWWPDRDNKGRDLADDGRPCWGESAYNNQESAPVAGGGLATLTPGARLLSVLSDSSEWYEGRGD